MWQFSVICLKKVIIHVNSLTGRQQTLCTQCGSKAKFDPHIQTEANHITPSREIKAICSYVTNKHQRKYILYMCFIFCLVMITNRDSLAHRSMLGELALSFSMWNVVVSFHCLQGAALRWSPCSPHIDSKKKKKPRAAFSDTAHLANLFWLKRKLISPLWITDSRGCLE